MHVLPFSCPVDFEHVVHCAAPGEAHKALRLTLLELYAEIARNSPRRPPAFTGQRLLEEAGEPAAGAATCAGRTEDALFDCQDQDGFEPVVPFLDGEPRSATARAMEQCEIVVIGYDALRGLLDAQPSLAAKFYRALAQYLGSRLRATSSDLNFARSRKR